MHVLLPSMHSSLYRCYTMDLPSMLFVPLNLAGYNLECSISWIFKLERSISSSVAPFFWPQTWNCGLTCRGKSCKHRCHHPPWNISWLWNSSGRPGVGNYWLGIFDSLYGICCMHIYTHILVRMKLFLLTWHFCGTQLCGAWATYPCVASNSFKSHKWWLITPQDERSM